MCVAVGVGVGAKDRKRGRGVSSFGSIKSRRTWMDEQACVIFLADLEAFQLKHHRNTLVSRSSWVQTVGGSATKNPIVLQSAARLHPAPILTNWAVQTGSGFGGICTVFLFSGSQFGIKNIH